jgi:hypothetical protein
MLSVPCGSYALPPPLPPVPVRLVVLGLGASTDCDLRRLAQLCPVLGFEERRHGQLCLAQAGVGGERREGPLGQGQFKAAHRDVGDGLEGRGGDLKFTLPSLRPQPKSAGKTWPRNALALGQASARMLSGSSEIRAGPAAARARVPLDSSYTFPHPVPSSLS